MTIEKIFTSKQLLEFNGSDSEKPVYISIKGIVFDVSKSRQMYTSPASYSVFSGKDASKALGKSSLSVQDCISDYSSLDQEEMETLDKWLLFFKKKYPQVGILVD